MGQDGQKMKGVERRHAKEKFQGSERRRPPVIFLGDGAEAEQGTHHVSYEQQDTTQTSREPKKYDDTH